MFEGAEGDFAGVSVQQQERQITIEKNLEQKVQEMLDQVLGPGKAVVKVSAEMDFSQVETKTKNVTEGVNTAESINLEELKHGDKKGAEEEGTQMGIPLSTKAKKSTDYGKEVKIIKHEPSVQEKRVVDTSPRLKKLSVGVMVDNLKPDQVATIEQVVREAVGIDSSRGDSIAVKSMPFNYQSLYDNMRDQMNSNSLTPPPLSRLSRQNWMPYTMMIPMVLILGVLAIFLLKQRKVVIDQSRMVFTHGPTATASDISDLLTDKSGKAPPLPTTQVNTTEELEKLAKEKPTRVAELLKSTWLSEKER